MGLNLPLAHIVCRQPLLCCSINDHEAEKSELRDILACRQLLLNAGADPTIPCGDGYSLMFHLADVGTLVGISAIKGVEDEVTLFRNLYGIF